MTVQTNRHDLYLEDAQLAARVQQWISETFNDPPSLYVEKFKERFPDDPAVKDHTAGKISDDELVFHVKVVRANIPITVYIESHGITSDWLVSKYKELAEQRADPSVSLRALNKLEELKHPEKKPARVTPMGNQTQINIDARGANKDEIVERVFDKIRRLPGGTAETLSGGSQTTRKRARKRENSD